VIPEYTARATRYQAARDRERTRSRLIGWSRVAVFLAAALAALLGFTSGPDRFTLIVAAVLAVMFIVLVVWHARIDARASWYDALFIVNDRALARIERRWNDLPPAPAPPGVDLAGHPYALDLDLFGRASLFQWLGPPATPAGNARLAGWILAGAEPSEVRERQAAVSELAPLDDWREQLAAHGHRARGSQRAVDTFATWVADEPVSGAAFRALVYVFTALNLVVFGAYLMGAIDVGVLIVGFLPGLVLSITTLKRAHGAFARAGAGEGALGRYADLLAHVATREFQSPALRNVGERLSSGGHSAPVWARKLNRLLGFADLARGSPILYIPIQVITLWDHHVLFALERWRRAVGPHMQGWMAAIGEVEALASLAGAARDNPEWCTPEIVPEARYVAERLGHPLIATAKRVANDVALGPPGTLLLVTGSNMSGKSTLLRAIGLNAVLAQAGGNVCAARLSMPSVDLQTSIRITDSLELGMSYFMAAVARLKGVVDAAEHPQAGRVPFYLLDEILQGTNSGERGIAVQAVARHLLDAGAIGAMSTHDLHIAGEEPLKSAAQLVHFVDTVRDDGTMHFDYTLRPGLATSRNALRLMKMIGIDAHAGSAE
jgi:hypothetical protein